MKKHHAKYIATAALATACVWLPGCASTPTDSQAPAPEKHSKGASLSKEDILRQGDVRGHTPVVFAKNVDDVRQAGLRALSFVGCEIKKQDPFFLSGRRPNKIGLLVGSGGETVNILLYPQSDTETHVWVETHKSFVGLAGQQGWNKQVTDQMTQLLGDSPK